MVDASPAHTAPHPFSQAKRKKHGYQTVELEEAWYTALKDKEKGDYTKLSPSVGEFDMHKIGG